MEGIIFVLLFVIAFLIFVIFVWRHKYYEVKWNIIQLEIENKHLKDTIDAINRKRRPPFPPGRNINEGFSRQRYSK